MAFFYSMKPVKICEHLSTSSILVYIAQQPRRKLLFARMRK